jgi:imidazolonepropionase-like amidohydrolase
VKSPLVVCTSTFCLAALSAAGAEAPARPIAFTHAVVLDGNGGPPIEDGVVVVRGERIEAVGTAGTVPIPAGADLRDVGGKVVMPGLADMHVHLAHGWDGKSSDLLGYQRYLNGLLYAGVTTVLDAGNVLPFVVQLRDEVAAGRVAGPRIYCAGPLLDGADPMWQPISYSIGSVDQVPGIVRRLKQDGVDVLKIYVGLSDALVSAVVREARSQSLPVLVDQSWRNGSLELVMGDGVTSFAHLPDFPPGAEALAAMKQRGVSYVTTLACVESFARRRLADLAFLETPLVADTTPPAFLAELRAEAGREPDAGSRSSAEHNSRRFQMRARNAKTLFDAGLLLAAGTDAPYPGVFQGEGLHRELELLVEAGLQPLQAITLATRNAARLVGGEAQWGTLEPGRRADLLVIDGRPDRRIQDSRRIVTVVREGRIVDRARLVLDPKRDVAFRPLPGISSQR